MSKKYWYNGNMELTDMTVGRIYEVEHGVFLDDAGDKRDFSLWPDTFDTVVTTLDDITTLTVGTVLCDEKGTIRRVLAICGEIIFYSKAAHSVDDDQAHSFRFGQTCRELQQRGWTVQGEEPVRTMTRAEAEAQLGFKIEG